MRGWTLVATALIALALSACNSTESVLGSGSASQASTPAGAQTALAEETSAALQPSAAAAQAATLDPKAAALVAAARVQIAPIVGATVDSVTPLSRRMSVRAAQRGIALAPAGDTATTHMMKGYFSAFTEAGDTTVIYVWDVLDPSGNRLHRIQGQEVAARVAGEGWESVPSQTMETIADATIDQLTAWLAARQS